MISPGLRLKAGVVVLLVALLPSKAVIGADVVEVEDDS